MNAISRVVGAVALFVVMGLVHADTFSPNTAAPGGTVTLMGQARPNSPMSAYFSCDGGCGQTPVGVATTNAQGQYSLAFRIPANARPGGAFVQIGCDNCGNGWRRVTGLQVAQGAGMQPPPSNALSPNAKQQALQVGQQLHVSGTNVLAARDQVIRSVAANNPHQVDSILNSQDVQRIGNNFIAIGDQVARAANDGKKEALGSPIANLKNLRNDLLAKEQQVSSVYNDNNNRIVAQQPAINKQVELQHFWESDRDKHARNSDDAARRCKSNPLDLGACGYWPQEAAAIETAKAKIALAVAQILALQAAIVQNQINRAVAQAVIDLVYVPQIRVLDDKIAVLQGI